MSTTCLLLLFARQASGNFGVGRSCVLQFVKSSNIHRTQLEMLGQAKISSFFTTAIGKRNQDDNKNTDAQQLSPPPKKGKIESPISAKDDHHQVVPLSPEQQSNIEKKRLNAKLNLIERQTSGVVVNLGPTWLKALEAEFSKPYFQKLSKFVDSERRKHTVFPPVQDVFSWTQMCPIREVKVVILGQDPYHGPKQAHGLCFSVQNSVSPPPSLENMFKELTTDIDGFMHPGHGNLTGWAQQGVLLLNAVLTVQAHQANSHKDKGWETFTDSVIAWLNRNLHGVVFMLWGSYAHKKGAVIDKKRHHVLKAVHPSPLSAYRGFFGCKHFSQANDWLVMEGRHPIDWTQLPRVARKTL
ncbi:Uracil-DNA glycosylase [Lamellibrachia satsuma]|nr:Uracil-DNA glycosylase [Lamellibrachia satsuma]